MKYQVCTRVRKSAVINNRARAEGSARRGGVHVTIETGNDDVIMCVSSHSA